MASYMVNKTSVGVLWLAYIAFLGSLLPLQSAESLNTLPMNLAPVSRILFSDPNQDSYQGWQQSADRQFWALQSFHRGDGSAPAPRLLIGNHQGKVIGTVSGTFATFDWGSSGRKRHGPIVCNATGTWCVMLELFGGVHQFIVNGTTVGSTPRKPIGWGVSRTGKTSWFAYTTGDGALSMATVLVDGRPIVSNRYVSFPRTPDGLLSPDGNRIAFASGADQGFFDLTVDDKTVAREFDELLDVAWSSDSAHVAAIIQRAKRCSVLLDGKPIGIEHGDLQPQWLGFDPTGAAVAALVTQGKQALLLWNGTVAATVPYHRIDFQLSALSPNGRYLAVCAQQSELTVGPITVLDTTTGATTTIGSKAKAGQVTGGDGRFAVLDDGTPIIATVTEAGHALFRADQRVSIANEPNAWSQLIPSPDGRFLMASTSGHPFPCFVNGTGVGKVGEQYLRAWWSADSQYLAVVTKDRGDKQVISVNGTSIQRMDECLAAWFDGHILRYFIRRGDTVSMAAVSLDGKPLPADDAAMPQGAASAAAPKPAGVIEPLPAIIVGKWRIDARRTLLALLKVTEDDLRQQLNNGQVSPDQIVAAEEAIKAKRVEIRADRLRIITGDLIAEQTIAVTNVENGVFHVKTIDPPGSTLVMTPGTGDRLQTLTVVMNDGTNVNTLYLIRKP